MGEKQVMDLLRAGLDTGTDIQIEQEHNMFTLKIVGDEFASLSIVRRHQKIYEILSEPIQAGDIHAVNIQVMTTQEQQKQ